MCVSYGIQGFFAKNDSSNINYYKTKFGAGFLKSEHYDDVGGDESVGGGEYDDAG